MFVNVELPVGADCHCTVGAGVPWPPPMNVAAAGVHRRARRLRRDAPGRVDTVSVAAFDVAVPTAFVNTARYWLPLLTHVVPRRPSACRSCRPCQSCRCVHVEPPSVDDLPLHRRRRGTRAAAVNVAVGAGVTVGVGRLRRDRRRRRRPSASPASWSLRRPMLVNTARNCVAVVGRRGGTRSVSVVVVAPVSVVSLVHVVPPSVDDCHCTVGVGLPEAAAVNDAEAGVDGSCGRLRRDGRREVDRQRRRRSIVARAERRW